MGYQIRVNGEVVWEADGSHEMVTELSVTTPRGEAAFVRVPPEEKVLDIIVKPRSLELAPLDLVDKMNRENAGRQVADLEARFGGGASVTVSMVDQEFIDGDILDVDEEFPRS